MALPIDSAPGIAPSTLGTEQIALLLRVLRRHSDHLYSTELDAKRFRDRRQKPCYIVDFQELFVYMHSEPEQEETRILLEYLFDQPDIVFILGPGTVLEIARQFSWITGIDVSILERQVFQYGLDDITEKSRKFELLSEVAEDFRALSTKYERRAMRNRAPLNRLLQLLERDNFVFWKDIYPEYLHALDQNALQSGFSALEFARPRLTYANFADALNLATVIGLQNLASTQDTHAFPFLLTHTGTLLREDYLAADTYSVRWGFNNRATRTPLSALYSHVALTAINDPTVLVSHLTRLAFDIAYVERMLKESPGYLDFDVIPSQTPSEWEELVRQGLITDHVKNQFTVLSTLVNDSIVSQAQAMFDLIQRRLAEDPGTRGSSAATDIAANEKLFDTIRAIAQTLQEDGRASEVIDLAWRHLIEVNILESPTMSVYQFADRNVQDPSVGSQLKPNLKHLYLNVEAHADGYFAIAWPAYPYSGSAYRFVELAMRAYRESDISEVGLQVASEEGICHFDAELPISFDMIRAQTNGAVLWMRFDSHAFDLYFDVVPSIDSMVGITAKDVNKPVLMDLYEATSSRFLFRSWLAAALDVAGVSNG